MDKILDIGLGLPGTIVLCVVLVAAAAMSGGGPNPKTECEAAGGRYVQVMKSYHTCKMEIGE